MPTRHFLLLHGASPSGPAQLGITVTRKIGGAVARNRIKRAVRETFRHCRLALPDGLAVVVIARAGAAELKGRDIAAEIEPALHAVGALVRSERSSGEGARSQP
jgi:ribonuclease P protein component